MATYTWFNGGISMQHHLPGEAPFMANIDVPKLIAGTGPMKTANTSNVLTAPAATGFAAADVLQVFEVLAGFVVTPLVGAWVTTVEGGAATADIGNASATQTHRLAADAVGLMGTFDLNTLTAQISLVADTHLGFNTYQGVVFITNGTIDITFVTAATAVAIFDVWAMGNQCFYA